jgi:hypothetical protein
MVRIIDNRSEVRARVREVTHGTKGGTLLVVELLEVKAVDGYAELLASRLGQTLSLRVLEPLPEGVDGLIGCVVRQTGPGRFLAESIQVLTSSGG